MLLRRSASHLVTMFFAAGQQYFVVDCDGAGAMSEAAEHYRQNAANCRHLAEEAKDEISRKRFTRMAEAWEALAEEQGWLDGEIVS